MQARHTHNAEYTKLLAATRYTQHDLIVDGITMIAALALILAVLSQLGSN